MVVTHDISSKLRGRQKKKGEVKVNSVNPAFESRRPNGISLTW